MQHNGSYGDHGGNDGLSEHLENAIRSDTVHRCILSRLSAGALPYPHVIRRYQVIPLIILDGTEC